jgi:hypothetical protein
LVFPYINGRVFRKFFLKLFQIDVGRNAKTPSVGQDKKTLETLTVGHV